jgi:outer membrane murein-binding lipoprotein Lpp
VPVPALTCAIGAIGVLCARPLARRSEHAVLADVRFGQPDHADHGAAVDHRRSARPAVRLRRFARPGLRRLLADRNGRRPGRAVRPRHDRPRGGRGATKDADSASDWIELAIIAFILAGIGVAVWKGGAANPESTGSLGKKVNTMSSKVGTLSVRLGHLESEFAELKAEAATTRMWRALSN